MSKLVIACLALLSFYVHADSLSIVTLDRSYHYDRTENNNESHGGRGIEYHPVGEFSYGFLQYENSFKKPSDSLYFTYNNLLVGLANGYEDADKESIITGDDTIVIAGFNFNIDLVSAGDYSLALRLLMTPSVTARGLKFTYEWR